MITSLIETLELANIDHMTKLTMLFESSKKILLVPLWKKL